MREVETLDDPAGRIRAIFARPDSELDYARAKLRLDEIVDPSVDVEAALAALDGLASAAADLAGASRSEEGRLAALRRVIYESGPWNDDRPFAYDHADPSGMDIPNKLLHNYLSTRLGNCVSMPILFLILGERLALDLALARAPHHIFVRHRLTDGRVGNLETTSGAYPAREEWYRRNFPMTDRAVANGLYMRSLSRREGVALMAATVLEQLASQDRHDDAIAVARVILDHDPRADYALLAQASAYGALGEAFTARYPNPYLIPQHSRPRYLMLVERNLSLFAAAEALGWAPEEQLRAENAMS